MKRFLLVLSLLMCVSTANAMNIPTDPVGYAYSDGGAYYLAGPGTGQSFVSWLALGQTGIAKKFVLTDYYQVSSMEGFLTGVERGTGVNPTGNVQFVLYQGRDIPNNPGGFANIGDKLIETDHFVVPINGQGSWYGKSGLDITLAPGDYWFAAEGTTGGNQVNFGDYKLDGRVTTPEPASVLLLGGGLVGAWWRRRQHNT